MTVEKAIEILSDVGDINRCCAEDAEALDMAIEALKQQATRPTARWERLVDDFKKCSKCGKLTKFYLKYNYCPNCGARMETETKIEQGLNFTDQDTMMPAT